MSDRELIFLVQDSPEGGYEARAVGESIFTEGETIEEIKTNVRDAVCCHFEEKDRPSIVRLHYVRDEVIAIFAEHLGVAKDKVMRELFQ